MIQTYQFTLSLGQELVDKNIIQIQTCRDPEQTVDVLTKALPKPKHSQHRYEMDV